MGIKDGKFKLDKIDMIEKNKQPLAVGLITLLVLFSLYYMFYTPAKNCSELCKEKGFQEAKYANCKKITECESPGYPVPNPGNQECDGISSCCCLKPTCEVICKSEGYAGATNRSCTDLYDCKSPDIPLTTDFCSGVKGCCCEN